MPTFDYECKKCGTKFDILHLTREVKDDVVCPSCGSKDHKRLMSAPAVAIGRSGNRAASNAGSCCAGGSCGLN
ncbi:MAG TPA: zinc ribbon domain-containing protein [Bacteroidota bacterium]|nr:zinc ribbon domain-containing protein [Bacteroidota bacterium]